MTKKIMDCTHFEQRLVIFCVIALLALSGAYLTLLTKSVINISIQKEVESKILKEQTLLSNLETEFIQSKDRINLKLAEAQGFQKPFEKNYVKTENLTKNTVTMNNGTQN